MRFPAQEEGNVRYVAAHKAGLYARGPRKVQAAVADWLARGADFLRARGAAAHALAQPDAVWQIADEVWACVQQPRIASGKSKQPRHNK